jgi:CDP-4-dehydro-6-deoxyglucose reductase
MPQLSSRTHGRLNAEMHVVTLTCGRSFTAEKGQSLLEAAESASVRLPYSCRIGRCSTCKCKISGASHALTEEVGLTDEERSQGWSLACVREAEDDVVLEIEDLTFLKLPPKKLVPAKIDALELLSPDVMKVKLRQPPGSGVEYLAGQYADVIGPGGVRRSYSLASLNGSGSIELHIRRVDGGAMSDYWFNHAKLNDLLRIEGPKGTFIPRFNCEHDVVFLATGTGIAPIKAMIEQISSLPKTERPKSVRLFWGGRRPDDLYWDPKPILGCLSFTPTLSRPDDSWTGAKGYVQDAALSATFNIATTQVYACGSDAMVRSARSAFEGAGLPPRSFFSDAFVASN